MFFHGATYSSCLSGLLATSCAARPDARHVISRIVAASHPINNDDLATLIQHMVDSERDKDRLRDKIDELRVYNDDCEKTAKQLSDRIEELEKAGKRILKHHHEDGEFIKALADLLGHD